MQSNEPLEARLERLERVVEIQRQLIEKLGTFARIQQKSIEALAAYAGAEMTNEAGDTRAPLRERLN